MQAATEFAPVVKRIEVNTSITDAFAVFTAGLDSWWPKESHSIGEGEVSEIVVEARHDGRIVEVWRDGTRYEWARFTEWDPPHRFEMEWRPNPEPGPKTTVEVVFTPGDGSTVVELRHYGWERLGPVARDLRGNYETGWVLVLSRYQASFS